MLYKHHFHKAIPGQSQLLKLNTHVTVSTSWNLMEHSRALEISENGDHGYVNHMLIWFGFIDQRPDHPRSGSLNQLRLE